MKGSCHCKNIKFEVSEKPGWIGSCYCIDCRKVSGAPFLTFALFDEVAFTKGTPKTYQSSEKVERSFCDNCGASISFVYKEKPKHVLLCVGLFDEAEKLAPEKHIYTEQKLPWIHI